LTGIDDDVNVPLPSCPKLLLPQQRTVLSGRNEQLCRRPDTRVGVVEPPGIDVVVVPIGVVVVVVAPGTVVVVAPGVVVVPPPVVGGSVGHAVATVMTSATTAINRRRPRFVVGLFIASSPPFVLVRPSTTGQTRSSKVNENV
jgi:hypothetical protein